VIVFSSFADTAQYLYDNIKDRAMDEFGVYSALVTGGSRTLVNHPEMTKDFNGILMNFSPLSK